MVKFTSKNEEEECEEAIEVVSSTWVSQDKLRSYWPPTTVPVARAGRMATLHAKPDPETWQCLPITFVQSYSKFPVFLRVFLLSFFFSSV